MHDEDYCTSCNAPLGEDEALPLCDGCIRLLQWDEYIDDRVAESDEAPHP